ncbi:MAG: SH3 domain-containing protein [Anaerolineales bacterium]|nr:SH3 domain-containing protein [Anaerolineales bacterium]
MPASPASASPSASPTFTVAAPTKAVICTNIPNGKLHVRFDPGDQSEVRGYLTDGESVILSGEQKEIQKRLWVKLSHPIEGWVNASYLCEAEQ